MTIDDSLLRNVTWRCVGPPRGGRVVAVAGDPSDPMTFYFGACAGGVWKSTDGGTYWENVSDGLFNTSSVGAIEVSDSDPNIVYVGMGESCIRTDVSHGDGVYRSTDKGRSWEHLGLADTRHIARVKVHPQNPDLVYVAALGHAWGPNKDRGVFMSRDGGQTWENVLYKNDRTGAIDLSLDPGNPRVMFCAMWEVQRTPWSLASGGCGSGIHRSVDGGSTWEDISHRPGLPTGIKGRIGIAVSPAKTGRIWATIESEAAGLYRSEDNGDTWQIVSDNRDLQGRPWYYQHVFSDPKDPDSVWILNYKCWKSADGGNNFFEVTTPHDDNHDLWIDPQDSRRMIEGNDGGACVSFNGGESWSSIYNQLTAQFYHVVTDDQFPYRIYGTQQDNSAVSVPSRNRKGAIPWEECQVVGTAESGHIAVHPKDPNVVFAGAIGSSPGGGGNLIRYDRASDQTRIVTVWPELYTGWGAKDMKYRFQWTYPVVFSKHDTDTLYVAGNVVFSSTNQGHNWEVISPDLTRNDISTQEPSGGAVTKDTSGAEVYGTVFAFAESPQEKGVFWTGSDDGLVHISRNGGKTWDDITPKGLPKWALVCNIEPSPHNSGKAYLCATCYRMDDTMPYLFRTYDYGVTWESITHGIPDDDFTRVIREDPEYLGLIYSGTETGIYFSTDDGGSWQSIQNNLPRVPIYDLVIKDGDLIGATHGRGFWIMDDLSLLRQFATKGPLDPVHLFNIKDTWRMPGPKETSGKATAGVIPRLGKRYRIALETPATFYETISPDGRKRRQFLNAGENPPEGVLIDYFLQDLPQNDITLEIIDCRGIVAMKVSSISKEGATPLPINKGINRFCWNMHYPSALKVPGDKSTEEDLETGPLAGPGTYKARLIVSNKFFERDFQILNDLRTDATQREMDNQFDLLIKIRDKISETHQSIIKIRDLDKQVSQCRERVLGLFSDHIVIGLADQIKVELSDIENELIQVDYKGARDRLHRPARLNKKLSELTKVVATGDYAPTAQAYDVFKDLSMRVDEQICKLDLLVSTDVVKMNDQLKQFGLLAVVPMS